VANGFAEAPASWNVRYSTPDGFSCQLALRGENGAELLPKTAAAIKWLLEHDCKPSSGYGGNGKANANAPLCPTHGKPMKPSKHGSGWYCPVKVAEDDGTGKPVYCKQRVR
jgi:hypothetical protein